MIQPKSGRPSRNHIRRINEGTHNFHSYSGWPEGKVAILFFYPGYDEEYDKEIVMTFLDINEKEYEELSEDEKQRVLDNQYEAVYEDAVDTVEYVSDDILKKSFGDLYDYRYITLKQEPGYYRGCQWLFDQEGLQQLLSEKVFDEIYVLLKKELGDTIEDTDFYDMVESLSYVDTTKEYDRYRKEVLGYDWDSDQLRRLKDTLTDEFGNEIINLNAEFEDRIAKCADRAIREIAKTTGLLQIAYSGGGWGSPHFVQP